METELVREVPKEIEWDNGCGEIAQKAEKVLGYSWAGENLKAEKAEADLLQVLRELAVEPFTLESVERYKVRKRREEDGPLWIVLMGLSGILFGLTGFVLLFFGGVFDWTWMLLLGGPLFIAGIGMFVVAICCSDGKQQHWVRSSLKNYEGAVPEYALQTALEIEERCPEARFWVDSLQEHVDPFLFVEVPGSAFYYIEVWNEPEFKAKREV